MRFPISIARHIGSWFHTTAPNLPTKRAIEKTACALALLALLPSHAPAQNSDGEAMQGITMPDNLSQWASALAHAQGSSIIVVLKDAPPAAPAADHSVPLEQRLGLDGITGMQKAIRQTLEAPARAFSDDAPPSRTEQARQNLQNMYRAEVIEGRTLGNVLMELNNHELVAYAEPDVIYHAQGAPSDPLYEHLYSLHNVGQIFQGSNGIEQGEADEDIDWQDAWENPDFPIDNQVIVAVLDTGVDYSHPDIDDNMWVNVAERAGLAGVDDDGNGYIDDIHGYDFLNEDADPADDNGHGTHCAGTIAAEVDNGIGIVGVNPYARIMALKFLGEDGSGRGSDAVYCITYAVENGAQVLSNSWGGGGWSQAVQDAVDYATGNGVVFVAAAGNSNSIAPHYPSAYNGSISVASLDSNGVRAWYSNYGDSVDISAPGSSIVSLRADNTNEGDEAILDDGSGTDESDRYIAFNGTSMACPHVSGVISLLIARDIANGDPVQSPDIYELQIQGTADDISANNPDYFGPDASPLYLGTGRVNVSQALFGTSRPIAFLSANWTKSTNLQGPGATNALNVEVGVYGADMSGLTLTATPVTSDIALNTNSFDIPDLSDGESFALPEEYFAITVSDEPSGFYMAVDLALKESDGTVLDTQRMGFYLSEQGATYLASADMDGDGINEIGSAFLNYLLHYTLNEDNEPQFQWIAEPEPGHGAYRPAIGDLDGDGQLEYVMSTWKLPSFYGISNPSRHQGVVAAYDANGTIIEGFPLTFSARIGDVTLGDLDGDGDDEVLIAGFTDDMEGFRLQAYDGDGSLLWTYLDPIRNITQASIGDVDGDGAPEVVVCARRLVSNALEHDSKVLVLDNNGQELARHQFPAGWLSTRPALADTDGDGDLEIAVLAENFIIANNEDSAVCELHHLDAQRDAYGNLTLHVVPNWPFRFPETMKHQTADYLKAADLDHDGDAEWICSDHFNIYMLEADASHALASPIAHLEDSIFDMMVENIYPDDPSAELIVWAWPSNLIPGKGIYDDQRFFVQDTATGAQEPSILLGYPGYTVAKNPHDQIWTTLGNDDHLYGVLAAAENLFVYDTGYTAAPLARGWPAEGNNHRRSNALLDPIANAAARVEFTAARTSGLNTLETTFSATPLGFSDSATYAWDFDNDGSTDFTATAETGGRTPTHTYTSNGIYAVKLTVTEGENTFTRIRWQYIHVFEGYHAGNVDFSADYLAGDAPVLIDFTPDLPFAPDSYLWEFGDGSSSTEASPSHLYETSGSFTVSLTVTRDFNGQISTYTLTKTAFIELQSVVDTAFGTIYVSPQGSNTYPYKSWAEAATSPQSALDLASDGDTILIDDGTYNAYTLVPDDGSHAQPFQFSISDTHNVTINSRNGAAHTTLEGWGSWRSYGNHAVLLVENCTGLTLDGLTFTNGTHSKGSLLRLAEDSDLNSLSDDGIDEWCDDTTIRNCVFRNNHAEWFPYGGGIYITGSAHIDNCLFTELEGGFGTAIYLHSQVFADDTVLIENSTFTRNGQTRRSQNGIILGEIDSAGTFILRNSLFAHNGSNDTLLDEIISSSGDWLVENCTFASNTFEAPETSIIFEADTGGNAVMDNGNYPDWIIRNTIIHGNGIIEDAYVQEGNNATIHFEHCITQFDQPGTGNSTADPRFLAPSLNDFHLAPDSPALDAGLNQPWMSTATDYPDGQARIIELSTGTSGTGTVDIGIDEASGTWATLQTDTTSGQPPLNVVFTGGAITPLGVSIIEYTWTLDGVTLPETGATLNHEFTQSGTYLVRLTVTDDNGLSASMPVQIIVDGDAPTIVSIDAPGNQTVLITFDEALDHASASNPANYTIAGFTISEVSHSESEHPDTVTLTLTEPLTPGQTETLEANNLQDIYGNPSGPLAQTFKYDVFLASHLQVDFGKFIGTPEPTTEDLETYGHWNHFHWQSSEGAFQVTNCVNSNGTATEAAIVLVQNSVSLQDRYAGYNEPLAAFPAYPNHVIGDFMGTYGGGSSFTVEARNLVPNAYYTVHLYGLDNDVDNSEPGTIAYTVQDETQTLEVRDNFDAIATFDLIKADSEGVLTIRTERLSNQQGWAPLNALEIIAPGIRPILSGADEGVAENGSAEVFIELSSKPDAALLLTIQHSAGDPDLSVDPNTQTLTFQPADWDTPQSFIIHAASDGDNTNDTATFEISGADIESLNFSMFEIDSDDLTAPAPVTNLQSTADYDSTNLQWTNPGDSDFADILIVRSLNAPASSNPVNGQTYRSGASLGNGFVVYAGNAETFTQTNQEEGLTYHYSVFARDHSGNYSPKASTIVTVGIYTADTFVTSTADSGAGSLRQLIADAQDGETIGFDPSLSGQTIQLDDDINIQQNITIVAHGDITLRGNGIDTIFDIIEQGLESVTLVGLKFTNGGGQNSRKGGALAIQPADYETLTVNLLDCTFTGNTTADYGTTIKQGGAIFAKATTQSLLNLNIRRCTFDSNSAMGRGGSANGGAICFISDNDDTPSLQALIENCTFVNNIADAQGQDDTKDAYGGAIYADTNATAATAIVLRHCTFVNNGVIGPDLIRGGNLYLRDTALTMQNCLIAHGNLQGDKPSGADAYISNVVLNTISHNLIADAEGHPIADGIEGNLVGVDPLVELTLANHGGLTQTLALQDGSPALNAGTVINTVIFDQRGVGYPRWQQDAPEIGSWEFMPPGLDTFVGWIASHSITGDEALPLADSDRDGLPNLLEFALHLDPNLPDAAKRPYLSQDGDALGFVFRENPEISDVYFTIEYSSDLKNWFTGYSTDPSANPDGSISLDTNYDNTAEDGTPQCRVLINSLQTPITLRLKIHQP